MRTRGFSLVELLVVVAIVMLMAAVAFPMFRPMFADAHLVGAARTFCSKFRLARSIAVRRNVYTAIRFEPRGSEIWYSVYQDGNNNGVLSVDIGSGRDVRVAGPFPLTTGGADVRVAINPDTPAPPPDSGLLSGDPIRFGRSDIVSFSPLGTATPGTLYLAGDSAQAAVRVVGSTARTRLLVFRGGHWTEH
ncbi:MAG TPA: GspH/FimT family pseudopilin [Vicinamibacteria bacterium]|nr:GspH/FimT family pseudopilin [Vicinamibacteria bacterium]